MALHKKEEAICLELGDRAGLQASYGNQALILQAWGRLEEAMVLHKKEEAICLELGDRAGLQRSYGNQAIILRTWGRLEEAMALLQKREAICLELGDRANLARCYWSWGLLARLQNDPATAEKKVAAALATFTELGMVRESDAVRKEIQGPAGGT
jgi:tetratricopeptide (TPR) repeat protein